MFEVMHFLNIFTPLRYSLFQALSFVLSSHYFLLFSIFFIMEHFLKNLKVDTLENLEFAIFFHSVESDEQYVAEAALALKMILKFAE